LQLDGPRYPKHHDAWLLHQQGFTQAAWPLVGQCRHLDDVSAPPARCLSPESLRARKGGQGIRTALISGPPLADQVLLGGASQNDDQGRRHGPQHDPSHEASDLEP